MLKFKTILVKTAQNQKKVHFATLKILALAFFISCGEEKQKTVAENEGANSKPNILIVITDDQGYGDLGHHGNPYIKTPNLDTFATTALELTNFHVGTTCAPTRAGLMTGRNANRNNAWHTIAGCSILLEDELTMAEVFGNSGYRTGMFGKWHLGDNYPFRPHDRGFQNAFYHGGGGVIQTPDYWNNDYFDDTYFRNGKPEKTSGYCTDVWFDEAIAFTKQKRDNPFFIYLALNAAHGPFNVPEEYAKMYSDAPLTEIQKRFYGMITNIDENFGRMVAHLKETGQFDNTIIIFTTDNGTAAGIKKMKDSDVVLGYNAGLRGTKGSHYDGGHRVPFFMSWPNGDILQGQKLDDLTAHVDLLPTLAAMSGVNFEAKKSLDGTNMSAVLRGKDKAKERMLVIDTQRNQWPEKGRNSCVMSTEWRLVNGTELYNFFDDPGQESDVSAQHVEIVKEMQVFYDQWWKAIEPEMRYAEIPLGHEKANDVLITAHDMHVEKDVPWNQVQIRKGEAAPDGYYSVKVLQDGNYRFKMYRYPPESGLSLNAVAEPISSTEFQDGYPEGKSINPARAIVQLGDIEMSGDVDASKSFAVLEGNLNKGNYELRSNFITTEGKRIPSYYTVIERLNP